MFERIGTELYVWVESFVSGVPGIVGVLLRRLFYRRRLKRMGAGFKMGMRGRIQTPSAVSIGDRSGINDYAWIAANPHPDGWISVGNDVLLGPFTILHTGKHVTQRVDIPINRQGYTFAPIVVEDDVWIGARVTVLAGVTLGKGTVVAAGAVVTRSTEPYSIVAGVPARKIRDRCMATAGDPA
jgi:acetyltransferase-like isoleucine patch superfamily enzyme